MKLAQFNCDCREQVEIVEPETVGASTMVECGGCHRAWRFLLIDRGLVKTLVGAVADGVHIDSLQAGDVTDDAIEGWIMRGERPEGSGGWVVGGDLRSAKWTPSADLADSETVIEKMRERGFSMRSERPAGANDPSGRWVVQFQSDGFYVEDTARSRELAICRAALKAVVCPDRARWVKHENARAGYRCVRCGRGWDPDEYAENSPPPAPHFEGGMAPSGPIAPPAPA